MATLTQGRKVVQTWSFRGSKSRNKVSVGEPAEGSLMGNSRPVRSADQTQRIGKGDIIHPVCIYLGCFGGPPFRRRLRTCGRIIKENAPFFEMGSIPKPCIYTFVALAGRLQASAQLTAPARGPKLVCLVMSEYYIIVKTFNNGSLGSGIDEERSEMR